MDLCSDYLDNHDTTVIMMSKVTDNISVIGKIFTSIAQS